MLYEVITPVDQEGEHVAREATRLPLREARGVSEGPHQRGELLAALHAREAVITAYSIHYTKLYEPAAARIFSQKHPDRAAFFVGANHPRPERERSSRP